MTSATTEILNSIDRLRTEELKALIQTGIDDLDAGRRVDGRTAIEQLRQKNRDRASKTVKEWPNLAQPPIPLTLLPTL